MKTKTKTKTSRVRIKPVLAWCGIKRGRLYAPSCHITKADAEWCTSVRPCVAIRVRISPLSTPKGRRR